MNPRKIAVTTDFSESSRKTFPAAAALARRFGAEIHVLHLAHVPPSLISPWPEVGPFLVPDDFFGDAAKKLDEFTRSEEAFRGIAELKPRIVRGETVDALRDFLVAEKIDLLVMAPQGLSAVKRFLLGSFTERMLRVAPCPVLVYHAPAKGDPAPFDPHRILASHDFSPICGAATALAREWTAAWGASARLLFVVEHQASIYEYAARWEGTFQEHLDKVRGEALRRLKKLIDQDWKGLTVEPVVVEGDPVERILAETTSWPADLLVMGTHSKSGLERFLGGVAQKVLRRAPCPVLVTRGTGG